MMNSNSTHKVVVGIGLAAVFGVGVCVFAVRAKHESEVARTTPALTVPAEQNADTAATEGAVQTPAESTANPSLTASTPAATTAPAAVTPAPVTPAPVAPIAPVAGTGLKDAGGNAATADRVDRHIARARSGETAASRIASAANSRSARSDGSANRDDRPLSAPTNGDSSSGPGAASAEVQQPALQSGSDAPTNAGASGGDAGPSDSQITANVKSEIATAAPSSTVDVTTSNGTVALVGSVPSQDAADQAKQAAQRVAGVKRVDASALTVSNQ